MVPIIRQETRFMGMVYDPKCQIRADRGSLRESYWCTLLTERTPSFGRGRRRDVNLNPVWEKHLIPTYEVVTPSNLTYPTQQTDFSRNYCSGRRTNHVNIGLYAYVYISSLPD